MQGVNHINEYWWLFDCSHIQTIQPATIELRKQTSIVIFLHICIKIKKAKSPPLLTYGPQTQKIKVYSRIQLPAGLHAKGTVTCCHPPLLPLSEPWRSTPQRGRRCPPMCPTEGPALGRRKASISLIPGLKQLKL